MSYICTCTKSAAVDTGVAAMETTLVDANCIYTYVCKGSQRISF